MKTLFLLRHAHALAPVGDRTDFERQLSEHGKREADLLRPFLGTQQLDRLLVVSSTAMRARETAEILMSGIAFEVEVRFSASIYEANVSSLVELLSTGIEEEKASVLLVGHNPGMENLLRFLTGEVRSMSTGALAKINLDVETWESLIGGVGHLESLVTPGQFT